MRESRSCYRELALRVVRMRGIARASDFTSAGIPLVYLKRLTSSGEIVRLGRGLYQVPENVGVDAAHDLAEAARRVPGGVICLISALRCHGLTTQSPSSIWMTIPHKARRPSQQRLRYEIVRASGEALTTGIEYRDIEGVSVPVYSVAKTVADCFKHRRYVGEDVAVEALRDALSQHMTTHAELSAYAAINRVAARMAPHLRGTP